MELVSLSPIHEELVGGESGGTFNKATDYMARAGGREGEGVGETWDTALLRLQKYWAWIGEKKRGKKEKAL